MKCYNHSDIDAVCQCVDCGKGLCKECADKFETPICDQCNLKRIDADRKLLIKNAIITVIGFIIGFSYGNNQGIGMALLYGYFCAGIPWGWSILTKITPNMFLFLSWLGWLIYFLIKFTIAALIGMFVTPFKIYKIISGLIQAQSKEKYTRQN